VTVGCRLDLVPFCALPKITWENLKAIDVSPCTGCPKSLLDEEMDTPNGGSVRRYFRF
jgi:hypothetical protein